MTHSHPQPPLTRGGADTPGAPAVARHRLALGVTLVYTWLSLLLLGAIVLETFMVYPNVFSDPPRSLELTMQFLAVTGPSDFFPPLGLACWVLGASALLVAWRWRAPRWLILLSLAMFLGEGLASILYFWPRNDIMFVEGTSVHSSAYLAQVAQEFQTWHWRSRMGFNTIAAASSFAGFIVLYRDWVVTQPLNTATRRAD